jgi:hypothetical protein
MTITQKGQDTSRIHASEKLIFTLPKIFKEICILLYYTLYAPFWNRAPSGVEPTKVYDRHILNTGTKKTKLFELG